ncbi:MAG: hypothetical protein NZ866_02075 [Patescibacteria group bacterium]|nr:hypothetical protein [Patescibacteria group bacterium]
MSYTNYSWCTITNATTNYLVSSFYLVNNPYVYISFEMPTSDIPIIGGSYEVDSLDYLCRTSSMYLPLGYSEEVDNINQLVIASTTNYQNGALYRRRYEKGLVLLNTSNNLTFNYLLSSTTEPYTLYNYHLVNIYNFSTSNINLSILSRTGLILYNDEVGVELFP